MAIIHEVIVEVANIIARNAGEISSITTTTSTPSPSDTNSTPTPTQSNSNTTQTNSSQSPLLFFVALGFGVVFTNLWIIVGVKYCFRYNARNRAIARGEDGEPINLEAMPRPHRRRREKKLMTMDEVNERFPLTKYKAWVATRASEGLPTTGGVAVSPSKSASLRGAEGVIPASPVGTKHSGEDRPATATSVAVTREAPLSSNTKVVEGGSGGRKSTDLAEKAPVPTETNPPMPPLAEANTTATADTGKPDDEDEEEDQIHDALPPELLATPGDSCAICIDTIEEDDDIRGLTCGHAFHAGCLDPWLTSRRACCPLCKADYYVPKPRPEAEATEPERPRRPGRMNMPTQTSTSWSGIRGQPRLVFPGRFMASPIYVVDRVTAPPPDRRAPRHARRAASTGQAQSHSPAQASPTTGDAAAQPSQGFAARIGAANPFRAGWRPSLRFPSRSGREENTTSQESTAPAPSQLEQVVVT